MKCLKEVGTAHVSVKKKAASNNGSSTAPDFDLFYLPFLITDEAGSSILSQGAAGITVLSIGDGLSASKESED